MARPAGTSPRAWRRAPRGDAKRLAITFVTLLAFVLQTLLVQTHIHGAAPTGVTSVGIEKNAQPDKLPPAGDPANCPICQELLHAGSFVAPVAAALAASSVATNVEVMFVEILAVTQTYAHGWKSRAPPLA